jgi:hypothetical protein
MRATSRRRTTMSKVLAALAGAEEVEALVTSYMMVTNVRIERSTDGYTFVKCTSEKTGAPLSAFCDHEPSLNHCERAVLINPEKSEKGWKCSAIEEVPDDFTV